ncbi:acetyl-CoA carboxylase biotin carboxylase subunit [candidate division WOR-3 bacterium]|nr:acetyl-CoA carboxylase biotin carboxylase subunit [candidate division WOR-3 bacterium]
MKKILIANRGEIALRIIRAAKDLGLKTVAVFSEVDRDSLHVRFADETVCIGKAPPSESYLNIPRIIAAAEITGSDAIHPGYGFLAENPSFAEACEDNHFTFIGPPSKLIKQMGDKAEAKKIMAEAGVPVTPGSPGTVKNEEEALKIAKKIGYPVLVKAVAGGGGRGMRLANNDLELKTGFVMAQSESQATFGDNRLYIEKAIENPRHIEIQILADSSGKVIHLGERECSIQRRHQKLIEETPSPAVDEKLRQKMGEAAKKGVKKLGYKSAGTVEFIVDEDGSFYFMEMNTRIQVEHPITEMTTGVDILTEQIKIANGSRLQIPDQNEIKINGHSMEARINAEDPSAAFVPRPGTIHALHLPGGAGIRIDSHIYQGYKIPPNYDSLLIKLITYGENREQSRKRMLRALDEFVIRGVPTTIPLHKEIFTHPDFIEGKTNTNFLKRLGY